MLDIKFLRENAELVKDHAAKKRIACDVDKVLALDEQRVSLQKEVDNLRKERNEIAAQTPKASAEDRPALIERGKALKEEIAAKESAHTEVESAWKTEFLLIPNILHPDAPIGSTDEDNKVLRTVGEVKHLDAPKSHVELAEKLDLIDFERAAKVAGAKFYFLKDKLAILEQALVLWAMKEISAEGYTAMSTPDLARDEVLVGTGFNPRGNETQTYSVEGTDLSLVGTAEITLGGYHKDETIAEDQLPLKYVGVSHCYRTEAGAYGRESYGLYRVHQFAKVEMFIFCAPEQSEALHLELLRLEERVFTKLGIPYQVIDICSGDLGGPAYRKYDLEAWMWGRGDGKGGYGEVTSTSNCTDYQSRRLNVRMKRKDGSLVYAHTLNGTAVSLARALICILENYQQEDGSIKVPEVLVPYTGFDIIK